MMKNFKQKLSKNQRGIQNTVLEILLIYTLLDKEMETFFKESLKNHTTNQLTSQCQHFFGLRSIAKMWVTAYTFKSCLIMLDQVPWIVKTDDDTVNNVWKLNEVINNMEDKNETQVIFILPCLTHIKFNLSFMLLGCI